MTAGIGVAKWELAFLVSAVVTECNLEVKLFFFLLVRWNSADLLLASYKPLPGYLMVS